MSPPPPPPPAAELKNNALAEANITVEAVTDTTSATTASTNTKDGVGSLVAGNSITNTISDPTLISASELRSKATSELKWKPLTVEGVAERRSRAGKMIAGVAAPTNIPLYKGYYADDGEEAGYKAKPLARRWDRMLSISFSCSSFMVRGRMVLMVVCCR